jgi:sodium-type flagellar protein MotY
MSMKRTVKGCLALAALLGGANAALAELYMAPLDSALWLVEKSAIGCRLHQTVPKYGSVVFETLAGTEQRFYATAEQNPMRSGPSVLIAYAPNWSPERPEQHLGSVEVGEGRRPIELDNAQAERLLQALRDGLVPQLTRPALADADAMVRLGLSPVNFQRAADQYEQCIAQLLPFSFEQMANTTIQFDRDRADLDRAARKKIDLLLLYARAERRPVKLDIDVLSDDTFRRVENLELSKLRAQSVNDYLLERGIAPALIRTTYRTERGGRDASRRYVTIRMRRTVASAKSAKSAASSVTAPATGAPAAGSPAAGVPATPTSAAR